MQKIETIMKKWMRFHVSTSFNECNVYNTFICYLHQHMWNLVASNRILDMKWKRQQQRKHVTTLRSVKSVIDNSAPKRFQFLHSRPKAKQIEFQKQFEIQSHNEMLVQRMLNTSSEISRDKVFFKDSLNSTYTKKIDREIDENNQQLVKRLQSACSNYSKKCMQRSMRVYEKARTNIASQKMDPFYDLQSAPISKKSRIESSRSRPFSARP